MGWRQDAWGWESVGVGVKMGMEYIGGRMEVEVGIRVREINS